jgi:hypothetical protein
MRGINGVKKRINQRQHDSEVNGCVTGLHPHKHPALVFGRNRLVFIFFAPRDGVFVLLIVLCGLLINPNPDEV